MLDDDPLSKNVGCEYFLRRHAAQCKKRRLRGPAVEHLQILSLLTLDTTHLEQVEPGSRVSGYGAEAHCIENDSSIERIEQRLYAR